MFSRITIDESTVIPRPRIKPLIVIKFTVKSRKDITIRVKINEIGIERPMITELLKLLKNKKIMSIARKAPSIAELYTWFIVASIKVVSSLKIFRDTPFGSCSFI